MDADGRALLGGQGVGEGAKHERPVEWEAYDKVHHEGIRGSGMATAAGCAVARRRLPSIRSSHLDTVKVLPDGESDCNMASA